jgi:choline monooxygenase
MEGAQDFNVDTVRLPPLRVAEWQGLVFVTLSDETPSIDDVYGPMAERIAPYELTGMLHARRCHYDVACNWKVYVDNFLEGYHLPHVHPGLTQALDYRAYDTELLTWSSLQHSPVRESGGAYGEGEALYYFVYPNTMLNIVPGRLQTNRVVPLAPDRCRVEFDFFYAPAALSRADRDYAFTDQIQREDMAICEAVQQGLASGYYEAGRLNPKRESGVWHFQNLLAADYARAEGSAP